MKWTPKKRQELIDWRRAICLEIEQAGRPYQSKVEGIAARFANEEGFWEKNIRKLFDRWMNSEKQDSALDPYGGLFANKGRILTDYQLNRDDIRKWFKAKRVAVKAWAEKHGYKSTTVVRAINGQRVGGKSQEIMDRLANEIQGTPTALLEEAASLRAQEESLRIKISEIDQPILKATESEISN